MCCFWKSFGVTPFGVVKALDTSNAAIGASPGDSVAPPEGAAAVDNGGEVAVAGGGAVQNPPPTRTGPNGRTETEEEYQARMAHNAYMRFSRSLRRTLVCI